jgi:prepilin-type processing-associated H-X9-DG protein
MHVAMFPYYEQDNLRKNLVDNVKDPHSVNCKGPDSIGAQVVEILVCPSDSAMPSPPVIMDGILYFGITSYGGCSGTFKTDKTPPAPGVRPNGIFFMNSSVRMVDIVDGTSKTLMFGERSRRNLGTTGSSMALGGWAWVNEYAQEDNTMNTSTGMEGMEKHGLDQFGSQHAGGSISNFAFADGSVKSIAQSINIIIYQRLSTRAGGEVVDESAY